MRPFILIAMAGIAAGQTPVRELPLLSHRPQMAITPWESFLCELPDDGVAIAHSVDGTVRVTTVAGMGARIADTLVVSSPEYTYECFGLYRMPDHLVLAVWKRTHTGGSLPGDSTGMRMLHLTYRLTLIREVYPYPSFMVGAMDDSGNHYSTGLAKGVFVRKIDPDGNTVYLREFDSTHFIGGKRYSHYPTRIRILSDGNAYLVGYLTPPGYEGRLHGVAGYVFKMSPDGDSLGFSKYPDTVHSDDLDFWDVADDGTNVLICGAENRAKRLFLGSMPLNRHGPITAKFIRVPGSDWIRGDELAYNNAKRRFYLQGVHNSAYLYTFGGNMDSLQLLDFGLPSYDDSRGGNNDMILTRNGVIHLSVHVKDQPSPYIVLPILKTLVDDAPVGLGGKSGRGRGALSIRTGAWPADYTALGRRLPYSGGVGPRND